MIHHEQFLIYADAHPSARKICPCAPHCTDSETCATCAGNHLAVCPRCDGRMWIPDIDLITQRALTAFFS